CFLSTYQKRLDYIFLYETRIDATQHRPKFRSIEIDQGDFFPLDALPADIQPGTKRRLKELVSKTPSSLLW
ncbi:MAG: DNA mismatch repair protein MutT, partial [Holosporaceae bacterium]